MVRAPFSFYKGTKENRKVSHTKIISLTQQLDKDKSILDLVARSKKWQFLQTTYYIKFLIFPEMIYI
jgi:hypothetical protein